MALAPRVAHHPVGRGRVVRASNQGGWAVSRPTWARTADWLGEEPPVPPEREARAELVRRWLSAFGPATVGGRRSGGWGPTMTAVRVALADVAAVEVDLGRPGRRRAARRPRSGRPGGALRRPLPQPRPHHDGLVRTGVVPRPAPLPGLRLQRERRATAWWDGRVVGDWHQTDTGAVAVHLLEDVGADAAAALDAEAARLGAWPTGPASRPGSRRRWRSPAAARPPERQCGISGRAAF